MNKNVIKGFLDWYIRTTVINIPVSFVMTTLLGLAARFNLLPTNVYLRAVIGLVYSLLYAALFMSIIWLIQKRKSKENLGSLVKDVNKLKNN